MTSRQLIDFIERNLKEYGVEKVIPYNDVIEMHARRLIKQRLAEETIAQIADELTDQAKILELPKYLREQIEELVEEKPELPWDGAVARIVANVLSAHSNGAR